MKPRVLFPLLIVAAIALVYGRSIGFEFLYWDDNQHVTDNALLRPATLRSLASFWEAPVAGMYVPVSYSLFWLETIATGKPSALVFHATNVVLFALCALLVFRILRRITRDDVAALLGAVLFALHPLQVETAAWISETRGTLSALLGFIALDLWIARASGESRRPRADAVLIVASFALALLAKPSAVAFPLFAGVLALFVLRLPARAWIPWTAGGLVLSAVALGFTKTLQADEMIRYVTPLAERPRVALDALGFYIEKLFVPAGLAPDYGRRPLVVLSSRVDWIALALPFVVLALALARPAARATVLPGYALLIAALLPVLGLVPFAYQGISTVADRYAFLPMFGVALAVALVLARSTARGMRIAAIVVVGACGVASAKQTGYWRDTETLFTRALEINPESWVAHTNRGMVLLSRGDRAGALREYQLALEKRPDRPKSHNNIGLLLVQEGRNAEAIPYFERALELEPRYARAHSNLAVALYQTGKIALAEPHARTAVELAPRSVETRNTLANVLAGLNRAAEAAEQYEAALDIAPDDPESNRNYALLLERLGKIAPAIEHCERALASRPGWREAQADLHRMRARR